jgi:nucleoside-diphosphate-sugar epimerase
MKALVVGGTGPSGPFLVNGLLKRGYDVTVLHGGQHEVEFDQPVEHIHADPHFDETLNPVLEGRTFDLAVATYGRIRLIAEAMKRKTSRLLSVSGGAYAWHTDPRWGPMGPHANLVEGRSLVADDPEVRYFSYLIWKTEQMVLEGQREGHYQAAVFRYPPLYGPRAPQNIEWSVVRRLLDGRRQIIVGDGGHALRSRAYAENAAHAVLLAVDQPGASAGQIYNVADDELYSERARIQHIARVMGVECELVDIPHALAKKASPSTSTQGGRFHDIHKIQSELGYRDVVSPPEGLQRSVEWLLEHPFEAGSEGEQQLGDPFDYAAEDGLIRVYREGLGRAHEVRFPELAVGHMYRHPKNPGDRWAPFSVATTGGGETPGPTFGGSE